MNGPPLIKIVLNWPSLYTMSQFIQNKNLNSNEQTLSFNDFEKYFKNIFEYIDKPEEVGKLLKILFDPSINSSNDKNNELDVEKINSFFNEKEEEQNKRKDIIRCISLGTLDHRKCCENNNLNIIGKKIKEIADEYKGDLKKICKGNLKADLKLNKICDTILRNKFICDKNDSKHINIKLE